MQKGLDNRPLWSRLSWSGLLMLLCCLFSTVPARAQSVGTVVGQEGTAQALRQGASQWLDLAVSSAVFLHDELRTQAASKLQIRFQDDSVLTLAEETHLTVDENVVQPAAPSTALFSLLTGTLRALVTDRYKEPGAQFEVQTPTAVAGVRGTEFIIAFPQRPDTTRIIGLEDRTQADSRTVPSPSVFLTPRLFTDCSRTQACTVPQELSSDLLATYLKATTLTEKRRAAGLAPPAGKAAAGAGIIGLGLGLGLGLDGEESRSSDFPVMSGTQ